MLENTSLVVVEEQPLVALPVVRKAKKAKSRSGITPYKTAKGARYLAQVRLAGRAPMSKSFDSFKEAEGWKKAQEVEAASGKKRATAPAKLTMSALFDLYIEESAKHAEPLPNHQLLMFKRLKAHPAMGSVKVSEMSFTVMRDYCVARKNDGVHPSTVQAEFARVSIAIKRCADWLNWGENYVHPLAGAWLKLMDAGLIADSKKRTRRPSREERALLAAYFAEVNDTLPMAAIVEVAAINGFRRGEFPTLLWSNLDVEASTIVVMRKDSESDGGKRECLVPVLPAALAIIMKQPRNPREPRIFPHVADTIGQHFADAVEELRKRAVAADPHTKLFHDLRFHDLRHEAITAASRFLNQASLKALSGHKSDRHVARYINHVKEDMTNIAHQCREIVAVA